MKRIININKRGTITVPQELIKKYGLEAGRQIVIEENEEVLLLRPDVIFSIEIYSDKKIKDFQQQNETELERFEIE